MGLSGPPIDVCNTNVVLRYSDKNTSILPTLSKKLLSVENWAKNFKAL